MMKQFFSLCVVATVLFLQGCGPKQAPVPLSERVGPNKTGVTGEQSPAGVGIQPEKGKGGTITEEELRPKSESEGKKGAAAETAANALPSQLRDIYFEFDSYAIRSEDITTLKDIAAWLSAKPNAKITVEGHCDERGTIDYNLALGQKRAEAAKDYLVKLGVSDKRLKTISYGKEAPLDPGHGEEAWQKNRRVHFASS
jgi:peptidoglycan-associated lipoprotein